MSTLCQNCGFNNPPAMRFCGNCGTRLSDVIEQPVVEGTLPGQLGVLVGADLTERFREAGLQAAGQRRNVTILFADMSEYTSISASIDSEDLYVIIQQYIGLLASAVYKYEGMVDKIIGDGIMALFGAPIAHENNAERAIRSAMDMQAGLSDLNRDIKDRYGLELQMHIGLHSGIVVVGGISSGMVMDYTAIGDTVNLAQRLEDAAGAGTIMVSESVYRQTKMLFDYDERPGLSLKGIEGLVLGYQIIDSKVHPGSVRGLEGLHSPMVGRSSELDWLQESLDELIQHRTGKFILITGEAGLGKSRLAAEFKAQIRDDSVDIYEGRSLTYRRSAAYWIFLDLLHHYLGVSAKTPKPEIRAGLLRKVEDLFGERQNNILPYLEHLLSLELSDVAAADRINLLDANQLRQQIFIAVRDLLIASARRNPLLLILDDLHWADDASLELLLFLLDSVRQEPILICGITRPYEGDVLAQVVEGAEKRLGDYYLRIDLKNLPPEQSEQLLVQLLAIPDLPTNLQEQIIQRAAGNPFYLEEILRMLIDDNVIFSDGKHWRLRPDVDISSLGVPDNLQALILTRFDHLSEMPRKALQLASIIGLEFSFPLLNAVTPAISESELQAVLSLLVKRAFIVHNLESPQSEFAFRHALTSDAIYSTLLRQDRGELHGKVGEAIEILYADRLSEHVYLLARHFSYCQKLDRALHYLILAGQKSERDHINAQAQQYFEQALEILPRVEYEPSQALQVHTGLGDVMLFIGEYEKAREHYWEAQKFVPADDAYQAEFAVALLRKIGSTYERQGDYDQALEYLSKANQAIDYCSDELPVESAEVWNDIGWIHFRRGNFGEAGGIFQRALDFVVDSDAYGVIASIYNRLGGVAYFQGEWDQAASHLRNSISIRETIGDVAGLASSSNNLGNLEIEMGLFDDALAELQRNFTLVKRLGQVEGIAVAYNNLGWLYILRGELDEAENSLNEALELARQIGYISLIREVRKNIGELYFAHQQWDQAIEVLANVAPTFEALGANDQLLHVYRLLGETALGKGDLDQALSWARKLDEIAAKYKKNQTELPALQWGEILRFRGMLAIQMREWEQAEHQLQKSEAIFRRLRSRLYVGQTLYQLGRLAAAQDQHQVADEHFSEAVTIFKDIGACLNAHRAETAREKVSEE